MVDLVLASDIPLLFLIGHIDHSARVMRVITWNRSFRGLQNVDDGKDDFDKEENETHASVLDKLLAWEKKLYDEVKVQCRLSIIIICSPFLLISFARSFFFLCCIFYTLHAQI